MRSLKQESVFSKVAVIARWKDGLAKHEAIEDGIEVFRVAPVLGGALNGIPGKLAKVFGWYLGVLWTLRGKQVVCLNCHSLPVLPLSVGIKLWKRCVLIYEPHELETETASMSGWRKPVAKWVEHVLIRHVDAVCLVNQSIADRYKQAYHLKNVWIVKNVPYRSEHNPVQTGQLREAIGLSPKSALLYIYQGGLVSGRGVECLIDAFERLPPDKHLVLMGFGELESFVKEASLRHSNIHFMPAVRPEEVKEYTVDADVGLSLAENVSLNNYLCLPNKLFEYVACGVPPIVSDFPEMGRLVDEFDCGWKIPPNADALRDLINAMTPEAITAKRANTREASRRYCWQEEERALLAMYQALGLFAPRERNAMVDRAERI